MYPNVNIEQSNLNDEGIHIICKCDWQNLQKMSLISNFDLSDKSFEKVLFSANGNFVSFSKTSKKIMLTNFSNCYISKIKP